MHSLIRPAFTTILCFSVLGNSVGPRTRARTSQPVAPVLRTASRHPMQYYISIPEGWTPNRKWPIVVAITGGLKDFQHHAEVFAQARQELPFIVVTPVNLTNGAKDLRHAPEYHYADTVWDGVDQTGWCQFDTQGLAAVIADVQQQYSGQDKFFIAGHSAGAHLVWMTVFEHPEKLRAAATTGGNFSNRCIEGFSNAPERVDLPIRAFRGSKEPQAGMPEGTPNQDQFFIAKTLATAHGYKNLSYEIVDGQGHAPYPDKVLAYFNSLLKGSEPH